MTRKQTIWFMVIAFFVGAAGSIFFNRFAIPHLSTISGFGWVSKLQSSAPIVITRREEVRLNEGVNLIELAKQAQTFVVSIYSPDAKFLGNGLIMTSDGLIFTTKEVLGSATQVSAVTSDGTVYAGTVRAMDRKSSIATLTIAGRDLPVAQFSDAGNMQIAQRIFALGRTNLEFTREFASGLISKTLSNNLEPDRVYNTEVFENRITTDASINAGYVGGPVVNLQGRVVGILLNSAGQILPAEAVDGALRTYLASGKITRPYVGLKYLSVSRAVAKLKNLSNAGAQVIEVEPNSPAAKAGLTVGDIIIEANGQKIENSSLEQVFVPQNANDIRLIVSRGTQQIELTLKPEMR